MRQPEDLAKRSDQRHSNVVWQGQSGADHVGMWPLELSHCRWGVMLFLFDSLPAFVYRSTHIELLLACFDVDLALSEPTTHSDFRLTERLVWLRPTAHRRDVCMQCQGNHVA